MSDTDPVVGMMMFCTLSLVLLSSKRVHTTTYHRMFRIWWANKLENNEHRNGLTGAFIE